MCVFRILREGWDLTNFRSLRTRLPGHRGCLTKERFRQIAQRKRKLSLRTSDRCHWCGNPPRFFESVSGGFPSDRGIPTKVVRYFLGMTVLFDARSFLDKFQFVSVLTEADNL